MIAKTFWISARNMFDDSLDPLGTVTIDERGVISIADIEGADRTYVEKVTESVNALENIRIKIPPPPEATETAVFRKTFERTDPEIVFAIIEILEQDRALILKEAGH